MTENYNKENEQYLTLHRWMLSELNLKGAELHTFAVIYGFSHTEKHGFFGNAAYLSSWANATKRSVEMSLNSLIKKSLIEKTTVEEYGIKRTCYRCINVNRYEKYAVNARSLFGDREDPERNNFAESENTVHGSENNSSEETKDISRDAKKLRVRQDDINNNILSNNKLNINDKDNINNNPDIKDNQNTNGKDTIQDNNRISDNTLPLEDYITDNRINIYISPFSEKNPEAADNPENATAPVYTYEELEALFGNYNEETGEGGPAEPEHASLDDECAWLYDYTEKLDLWRKMKAERNRADLREPDKKVSEEHSGCGSTKSSSGKRNAGKEAKTVSPRVKKRSTILSGESLENFNRFWTAYPKKVSVADAERAWKRIDPDDNMLDQMLLDIEKKKQVYDKWQQDGGRYIEYPATYLNKENWKDEITPGIRAGQSESSAVSCQNDISIKAEKKEITDEDVERERKRREDEWNKWLDSKGLPRGIKSKDIVRDKNGHYRLKTDKEYTHV